MWKRFVCIAVLIATRSYAADRDAAEWVLREGGRVTLNGSRHEIARMSDLPKSDFEVTSVDLIGTTIDPKNLAKISGLTTCAVSV